MICGEISYLARRFIRKAVIQLNEKKLDHLNINGQFLKFRFENIITEYIIFKDYYLD